MNEGLKLLVRSYKMQSNKVSCLGSTSVSDLNDVSYSQLSRMCDTLSMGISVSNGSVLAIYGWKK